MRADEIDAIGKARGRGNDSGSKEREQGLLQLLYEMDGFEANDGVLVVGATNRVALLDDALLRKGRFDMVIYMGRPSTSNRFKILEVISLLPCASCWCFPQGSVFVRHLAKAFRIAVRRGYKVAIGCLEQTGLR